MSCLSLELSIKDNATSVFTVVEDYVEVHAVDGLLSIKDAVMISVDLSEVKLPLES